MLELLEKAFHNFDFAMKLEDDGYRTLRAKEEATYNTGLGYVNYMFM